LDPTIYDYINMNVTDIPVIPRTHNPTMQVANVAPAAVVAEAASPAISVLSEYKWHIFIGGLIILALIGFIYWWVSREEDEDSGVYDSEPPRRRHCDKPPAVPQPKPQPVPQPTPERSVLSDEEKARRVQHYANMLSRGKAGATQPELPKVQELEDDEPLEEELLKLELAEAEPTLESDTADRCGAPTASGGKCKKKVTSGYRCSQHQVQPQPS
jgi:hypothetical protein